MQLNTKYAILNSNNEFVDFLGVDKTKKNTLLSITLENGMHIKCSENHIFLVNDMNVFATSLTPNKTYLSTISGDSVVKKIKKIKGNFELYDIVDSISGYSYITNGIFSHNCSFLGSGDNFIAEEYLKRIEENEIETPIRQEYVDNEMWIWEDPQDLEEYVLTIDASPGHGDDFSTINIYKLSQFTEEKVVNSHGHIKKKKITRNKLVQVAEYYNKLRPSTLGELAFIYGKKYNNAYIVCDITGSIGVQSIEKLFELGYDNIHYSEITHKPTRDMLSGYIKIGTKTLPDGSASQVDLVPGFLIGQNRGSVLTELQRAIHLAEITIKSIRLLGELKTFVNVAGSRVADHKRSFHDDSIIPTACAIYVVNYQMQNASSQKSKTKKMLDAMIKIQGDDVIEKVEKDNTNSNSKAPDYRVTKRSPYGSNSWLFAGLKK